MAEIFPKKMKFEPQWKKIYKARMPKRGTSELLRIIDAGIKPQDYDRVYFVENVLSSKGDIDRFVAGLKVNIGKIQSQYAKFKEWTDKEKHFLTKLIAELKVEQKFWEQRAGQV